jgi:hypothetical protein
VVNPADAPGPVAADEPLDDADFAVLDSIRQVFQAVDPMPADLPDRIRFAVALHDLEIEVARLTAGEGRQPLAARGEEQSRTITFDSYSLTIMIRIDANRDGTARIDGWLAPPQRCDVQIKTPGEPLSALADGFGRFSFGSVPRGTAQLVVRLADEEPDRSGRTVVTPTLVL